MGKLQHASIAIENDFLLKNNNFNNNFNDNKSRYEFDRRCELVADRLAEVFHNRDYYEFYCKVARNRSEAWIWRNVEQAQKGHSPAKLFSYLCKKSGL